MCAHTYFFYFVICFCLLCAGNAAELPPSLNSVLLLFIIFLTICNYNLYIVVYNIIKNLQLQFVEENTVC